MLINGKFSFKPSLFSQATLSQQPKLKLLKYESSFPDKLMSKLSKLN